MVIQIQIRIPQTSFRHFHRVHGVTFIRNIRATFMQMLLNHFAERHIFSSPIFFLFRNRYECTCIQSFPSSFEYHLLRENNSYLFFYIRRQVEQFLQLTHAPTALLWYWTSRVKQKHENHIIACKTRTI